MSAPAIHTVLFDLDGTLTDPKVGITRGVQHALAGFGIEVDDPETLLAYIGPPLRDAFAEHHGIAVGDLEAIVARFREYYLPIGLFENEVLPGVADMLAEVVALPGVTVAVATAKVDEQAARVLDHFGLLHHFAFVGGATWDARRVTKEAVIAHTLAALDIGPSAEERAGVVIVGDREHDIHGAHAERIGAIGVRWGYAAPGELEAAGAHVIVDEVGELLPVLRGPATWWV